MTKEITMSKDFNYVVGHERFEFVARNVGDRNDAAIQIDGHVFCLSGKSFRRKFFHLYVPKEHVDEFIKAISPNGNDGLVSTKLRCQRHTNESMHQLVGTSRFCPLCKYQQLRRALNYFEIKLQHGELYHTALTGAMRFFEMPLEDVAIVEFLHKKRKQFQDAFDELDVEDAKKKSDVKGRSSE